MSRIPVIFVEKAILLIAAVVPLAQAEAQAGGAWWYLAGSILAIVVGGWTLARNREPLLGPVLSRAVVLGAFGLLVYEFVWLRSIHVVALSHFMIVVCASKFLQRQTLRDDALFAILCLLLLVVAAIVSGNAIFMIVVLVYVTIGLDLLIRFNLSLERTRAAQTLPAIQAAPAGIAAYENSPVPSGSVVATMALCALLFGVAVFTFCPRFGAGMFGRPELRRSGLAVTGLSEDFLLDNIAPVTESERPVMRVQVDIDGTPYAGEDKALYLRGRVYDVYAGKGLGRQGWEWQRFARGRIRSYDREELGEDEFNLLPEYDRSAGEGMLNQHYTIEAGALSDPVLCALYPPVAVSSISSEELDVIDKGVDDQCLRARHAIRRPLRLTIQSPAAMTPAVVEALQAERERSGHRSILAHPPEPPLPREDEIRQRIAPFIEAAVPLDVPENRIKFARSLVEWLQSPRFAYTLTPPTLGPRTEPICDFLLRHRSGSCQHFASAMAVMCQLAGVPARLVSGYRCDSYNETGGFWSVRGKHAHAWVEVYIPGQDWVRFDPTPISANRQAVLGSWLSRLRNYGEYIQFTWGNFVLAYDADLRQDLLSRFSEWLMRPAHNQSTVLGIVTAFVYELFAWRVQMSWRDRLLYWIFALLIVALVVLIGYVVVVVTWRSVRWLRQLILSRRAGWQRAGDAVFYYRLCRRLSALGLRRRPDQTPAEFAADVAARHPALRPATEVVSAYYGVIYGNHSLSPDRRQAFEEFLHKLNGLDRAALETP